MLFNTTKTKVTYYILTDDAKAHLNIETSFVADDVYIAGLIKDATQIAENYIDADIAETTNVHEIYDYAGTFVSLESTPFISLESVTYLDSAAAEQTVTKADILIKKGTQKTELTLPNSLSTKLLTCNYTSGYSAAANVPPNIHRAILQKIADLYDVNRGSMMSKAFIDSKAFERALSFNKRIGY
jgi:uncharacterized phiE125 gp8 family phage protein